MLPKSFCTSGPITYLSWPRIHWYPIRIKPTSKSLQPLSGVRKHFLQIYFSTVFFSKSTDNSKT